MTVWNNHWQRKKRLSWKWLMGHFTLKTYPFFPLTWTLIAFPCSIYVHNNILIIISSAIGMIVSCKFPRSHCLLVTYFMTPLRWKEKLIMNLFELRKDGRNVTKYFFRCCKNSTCPPPSNILLILKAIMKITIPSFSNSYFFFASSSRHLQYYWR